jgi:rhodanese-related sulfurtransferase
MTTPSCVAAPPAASSRDALAHFRAKLSLETDCADVREAMTSGAPDFVLVDVRGPNAFARGHAPGAVNIPHRLITAERLASYPDGTLFVAYCAGPHCNGADRGAIRFAELGRPVKIMIGGMTGWIDEGFPLESERA